MSFFVTSIPRQQPHSRVHWPLIIGTLLAGLLLGGCGTARIAYGNAPSLAFWWLDGYLDFESDQAAIVRSGLQRVHDWHRKEELPLLLAQLANLQSRALEPVTPEYLCQLTSDLQTRYQTTLLQMVPTIAAAAGALREPQLKHLERELAKRRTDWQRDQLEGSAAERLERRLKQATQRIESFYGTLRPEQQSLLRTQLTSSMFDPALQSRESLRRHRDTLSVLDQIRTGDVPASQITPAVTALVQRSYTSPDAAYQNYLERLTRQSCVNFAALHNSMQAKQRAELADTLQSYANDLRSQLPAPSS